MISVLIALLIIAVVVYFAFWIIDRIPVPNPFNWIAKLIVGVIALAALLGQLGYAV
jgi:hypothetical protein